MDNRKSFKILVCLVALLINSLLLNISKADQTGIHESNGRTILVSLVYEGQKNAKHLCHLSARKHFGGPSIISDQYTVNKLPKTYAECTSRTNIKQFVESAFSLYSKL